MSGGTSIVALVSTLLAAAQAPPVSSHTIAGALVPLPEPAAPAASMLSNRDVSEGFFRLAK